MEEATVEGVGEQDYSVCTVGFSADGEGAVSALVIAQAAPEPPFAPLPDSERELPAQLVLLAMGFVGPETHLLEELGLQREQRGGTVKVDAPYTTAVPGIFAAGDARRGQSLIVWAINEGRQCARMVDRYLAGLDGARLDGRAAPAGAGEDEGLGGHSDADSGPEGPPEHVGPGIAASG
jgi:glutamate synthase (NADPH/NADH) small chain